MLFRSWGDRVVTVGGDAPVRVQSMTNTDTVDAIGTAIQVKELAIAGSELVRITVNTPEAAEPEPTAASASLASVVATKSGALAPVASAPTPVPTTNATPAKPAGASALVLRAKAQTWIEITDARGQVQFSRLMQPGEQADLDVALPAQLRIGNVAGTEVMLRGAHIDLASRSKDNVARIELN